jgi:hypothetical protein
MDVQKDIKYAYSLEGVNASGQINQALPSIEVKTG